MHKYFKFLSIVTVALSIVFSEMVISHPQVANAKHHQVRRIHRHHIQKHHRQSKPNGAVRYHAMSAFGFKVNPWAVKHAKNQINLPKGYWLTRKHQLSKSLIHHAINGYQINQFNPDVKDVKERVNLKHITPSQQRAMTDFAAQLINGVRRKLCVPTAPLKTDRMTMQMANEIAQQYNHDHWNIAKRHGHDLVAINKVAKQHALAYYVYNNDQCYEDITATYLTRQKHLNMANVKQNIYESIAVMLFNDGSQGWDHTMDFLSTDALYQKSETFGVAIDRYGQIHYEIVPSEFRVGR